LNLTTTTCVNANADSELSAKGKQFAKALGDYFSTGESGVDCTQLTVFTSILQRAKSTAAQIPCSRYIETQALREMEAGVCEGLTFEEVKSKYAEEYKACQQDILRFRYPRAENYIDVIARLEPLIYELEQERGPVVVVSHQGVLRCLYAYFRELPSHEIPFLSMPLHKLIKLEMRAAGCVESRFSLVLHDKAAA